MASGSVERESPVARPGGVSVGDLVAAVPRRLVEEAVDACGLDGPVPDGELPLHLTAYVVMALCLLPGEPVEDVAQTVVAELSRPDGVRGVAPGPLTASGIGRARRRLGPDVLRETFSLLATASSDWVVLGDRSRYAFATFGAAARIGVAQCWRVPPQVPLPVLEVLRDGSYLSVLIDPDLTACERAKCLLEAWSGVKPDPDAAHTVRVVEDGDADRLVTTLRDPEEVTAAELADAHRQWRRQSATDGGPCSALRGPGGVRSTDPDLVHQEIWAHLLVEYAVNSTTWA